MKRVKMIGFILLAVMILVMVAGCSSSERASMVPPSQENGSWGSDKEANGIVTDRDKNYGVDIPKESTGGNVNKPAAIQQKLIKDGVMTVESADVNATYATILAFAKKNGGYEFNRQRSKSGNYTKIVAVIKIKPDMLDRLMEIAGTGVEVIKSNISSEDITADYSDTKIRLKTQVEGLKKYYEFLKKAKNVDEILAIQDSINTITEEIESMKGQIRMWDALVGEATLTITLQQKDDPVKVVKEIKWDALTPSDMWRLISNGFITIVNTIVSILQWLIIFLVSVSPLLLIAGIILIIVFSRMKKKRKAAQAKVTEKSAE